MGPLSLVSRRILTSRLQLVPGWSDRPAHLARMHQLFRQVLGRRDLSRAGDLFSLADAEIEGGLSEALDNIKVISCSPVSQKNCQLRVPLAPPR